MLSSILDQGTAGVNRTWPFQRTFASSDYRLCYTLAKLHGLSGSPCRWAPWQVTRPRSISCRRPGVGRDAPPCRIGRAAGAITRIVSTVFVIAPAFCLSGGAHVSHD